VGCRAVIEPRAAVQHPSALSTELRCTPNSWPPSCVEHKLFSKSTAQNKIHLVDYEDSQDLILIMYYDLPKGNMEYRHQITLTRQDIFLLDDHITFLSYSIRDEK
jgi:hypothetical protein